MVTELRLAPQAARKLERLENKKSIIIGGTLLGVIGGVALAAHGLTLHEHLFNWQTWDSYVSAHIPQNEMPLPLQGFDSYNSFDAWDLMLAGVRDVALGGLLAGGSIGLGVGEFRNTNTQQKNILLEEQLRQAGEK